MALYFEYDTFDDERGFMVSKQDIRNKALHVFAYKGFSEATTDKIATSLGLKKQSLYSHYKSKNAIITDVLREQSSIISLSLEKTLNVLKDSSVENLLRGVFESFVTIFSNHERLLFWKRINVVLYNDEYTELLNETEWQYVRKLHDDLYTIISVKYPEFADPESFKVFFYTYLMVIQGYLDWMLMSRHDDLYFSTLWRDYWNGIKHRFSA